MKVNSSSERGLKLDRRSFLGWSALWLTWLSAADLGSLLGDEDDPPVDEIDGRGISLPGVSLRSDVSVEEAIAGGRLRGSGETFTLKKLSQLIWAGQGITGEDQGIKLRAAPSAGALYPMDLYAVLPRGVYRYNCRDHSILKVTDGDKRTGLSTAGLALVLTAEYERSMIKYRQRGVRYSVIEAGNISQNIRLQGRTLGVEVRVVGEFDDGQVQQALDLPKRHRPLLVMPITEAIGVPEQGSKLDRRDFLGQWLSLVNPGPAFGAGTLSASPSKDDPSPQVDEITQREISLPEVNLASDISLEEAISHRRSRRKFKAKHITLGQLSQLLWAGLGTSGELKAAPSAKESYPMNLYAVLPTGVYRYDPKDHLISQVTGGDRRIELAIAGLAQEFIAAASVNLVITAEYERAVEEHSQRGIRYSIMEVGNISENIYLQAESQGVSTVVVGAFYDDQVQQVLGLPKRHRPLLIMPVGYPLY